MHVIYEKRSFFYNELVKRLTSTLNDSITNYSELLQHIGNSRSSDELCTRFASFGEMLHTAVHVLLYPLLCESEMRPGTHTTTHVREHKNTY
jgi:hypothetical protein